MSQNKLNRRHFLSLSSKMALGTMAIPAIARALDYQRTEQEPSLFFKISLAQWSLHRSIKSGGLDPLDFAKKAALDFDIRAIEYVNQFYSDKVNNKEYLNELRQRSEDHGVRNLIVMVDNEGALASPEESHRLQAVDNHKKWIEWAQELGCHSVRVNLNGEGSMLEMKQASMKSLAELSDFALSGQTYIVVENHGGYSSNGRWLSGVIKDSKRPNCGSLPDFGNFNISETRVYDRYNGVRELLPYAHGVSAKSMEFDNDGYEVNIDYERMIQIVKDSGYIGHIGIEYAGQDPDEDTGIRKTKKLLERLGS